LSAIIVLILGGTSDQLYAQLTYQERGVSTPPPTPIITIDPPYVCTIDGQAADSTLPDDTFLKLYTGTWVNVVGNVTGACDWYIGGAFYTTETRYISSVLQTHYLPGAVNNGTVPYYPNSYTQSMDTRVAGTTSGPRYFSASGVSGRHLLEFQTAAYSTNCMIPRYSSFVGTHINAMQCKPEWFVSGPGGINYHPPMGPVTIRIPSQFAAIQGAVELAAADWSSRLGITITVTVNSTCSGEASCVYFKDDHGTLPNDTGCASFMGSSYTPTGEWTGSAYVRFKPNDWATAHPDRIQSVVAHELGHYFGLANRIHSSCSTAETIMGYQDCYNTQAPTSGTNLGPTASDAEALRRATRGGNNRKVCGW
jgi:hypothetical protein